MIRRFSVPLPLFFALFADAAAAPVPAEFVHDQAWLTPKVDGQELRFFTDTGGSGLKYFRMVIDYPAAQARFAPVAAAER